MTPAPLRPVLRAVIVDDEPLAREGVRLRLERAGDVEVVGESGDGNAAIAMIQDARPDVVFIDVQMPGATGIDVARSIGPHARPYFIFVTAFDAHAIEAFEVNALDFLVKPIADDRFLASLGRARHAVAIRDQAIRGQRLGELLADSTVGDAVPAAMRQAKLTVRVGNRIVLITPPDIDWIESAGDYAQLHVGPKTWLLRESMLALESRLKPHAFVRIHRGSIVNVDRVVELRSLDDGEYTVVLRDGTLLKLSRNFRGALPALLRNEE